MLDIEDKICGVIGGGKVAERKIRSLLDAKGKVTVISPELTPSIQKWVEQKVLYFVKDVYNSKYLQELDLVFACTNIKEINKHIAYDAKQMGKWVNAASPGDAGDMILPATLKSNHVQLSLSTYGKSPLAVHMMKKHLTHQLEKYEQMAMFLYQIREQLKQSHLSQSEKGIINETIKTLDILSMMEHEGFSEFQTNVTQMVEKLVNYSLTIDELLQYLYNVELESY